MLPIIQHQYRDNAKHLRIIFPSTDYTVCKENTGLKLYNMLWHNTSLQLQYDIYILNGLWSIAGPPPNKPPTIDCKSFNIPHPEPSGETEVEIKFGPFEGSDPEDGSIEYVNIYYT